MTDTKPTECEIELWDLLDDIDSASDIINPVDLEGYKAFYRYALEKAEQRHEYLKSDGYTLRYYSKDED